MELIALLASFIFFIALILLGVRVLLKLCKSLKNPVREVGFKMTLADFFLIAFLITMSIFFGSELGGRFSKFLTDNESAQVFIGMAVLHLLVIEAVFLFVKKSDLKPHFFLSKPVNVFKIASGSVGYFFGLIFLIMLVSMFWNLGLMAFGVEIEPQEVVEYFKDVDGNMRYFALFSVMVLAPVSEELVFRGVIYGALKARLNAVLSAIIVSILFATIHFSLPALLPIFFLSLLLIAVYERYGDLRASIIVHSLFNTLMSILMLFEGNLLNV